MAVFVIDASVTLAWCFEDETTAWSENLLEHIRRGDEVAVPAHWPTEVSNGMLMALRRKRILPGRVELLWDELAALPIFVESPLLPSQAKSVLALAEHCGLTVYDAAYLELAKRRGFPLATLDGDLVTSALAVGVQLIRSEP